MQTQRISIAVLLLITSLQSSAEVDVNATFDLLKQNLVGEWRGFIAHSGEPVEATFYLTGNDSAIVEYIRRPQKPKASMSSVYHAADDEVWVTHYCSFMNQPRLKATSFSAQHRSLSFDLMDVSNLQQSGDRYTHKMRVAFPGPNKASVTYTGFAEGQETGDLTVELERIE